MSQFNQVTIIGLGLIGGSLGMALRRHRVARHVTGVSRSASNLRRAKRRGAIDQGTTDLRRAVEGADVVVIATPVDTIVSYAKRCARSMPAGSVLTDVGSTKASIVHALERALPSRVAFVGGHPIAGSEQRGIGAAQARLFDGSLCIVTPTAGTPRRALRTITRLWTPLVEQVVTMRPREHDRLLAGTSHLPHLVASCLVHAVKTTSRAHTPRSFLEMTRIATSHPELWDDIFLTNRTALLSAMDHFSRRWRALRRHLARGDRAALLRWLRTAHATRHALKG